MLHTTPAMDAMGPGLPCEHDGFDGKAKRCTIKREETTILVVKTNDLLKQVAG